MMTMRNFNQEMAATEKGDALDRAEGIRPHAHTLGFGKRRNGSASSGREGPEAPQTRFRPGSIHCSQLCLLPNLDLNPRLFDAPDGSTARPLASYIGSKRVLRAKANETNPTHGIDGNNHELKRVEPVA